MDLICLRKRKTSWPSDDGSQKHNCVCICILENTRGGVEGRIRDRIENSFHLTWRYDALRSQPRVRMVMRFFGEQNGKLSIREILVPAQTQFLCESGIHTRCEVWWSKSGRTALQRTIIFFSPSVLAKVRNTDEFILTDHYIPPIIHVILSANDSLRLRETSSQRRPFVVIVFSRAGGLWVVCVAVWLYVFVCVCNCGKYFPRDYRIITLPQLSAFKTNRKM